MWNVGPYAIGILAFIPFFIWLSMEPQMVRFESLDEAFASLGQIAGLSGMALFSINIILSGRFKIFDDLFGGINRAYIIHHFIGGLAFCLLLAHPLLLACQFLSSSLYSAAIFLVPSLEAWQVFLGSMGLAVMAAALILTFYIKLKYQIWKFSHKFLGLAFFFASLHVFFIPSDVAENPYLRAYILILAAMALAVYLYRSILGKYLVERYDYQVSSVSSLDGITNLELAPVGGRKIKNIPGQFVFINFEDKGADHEVHPFSVSSAPDSKLSLTLKALGDYTSRLKEARAGQKVRVEGPYGRFSFRNFKNKNQIWIAGGIGITPFLSMARSMKPEDSNYRIDFYHSVKTETEFIFKSELERIAKENPNLRIFFWITDRDGFITAEKIAKETENVKAREVFVCGPPKMMNALRKQFVELGVDNKNIHSEEFALS